MVLDYSSLTVPLYPIQSCSRGSLIIQSRFSGWCCAEEKAGKFAIAFANTHWGYKPTLVEWNVEIGLLLPPNILQQDSVSNLRNIC